MSTDYGGRYTDREIDLLTGTLGFEKFKPLEFDYRIVTPELGAKRATQGWTNMGLCTVEGKPAVVIRKPINAP